MGPPHAALYNVEGRKPARSAFVYPLNCKWRRSSLLAIRGNRLSRNWYLKKDPEDRPQQGSF